MRQKSWKNDVLFVLTAVYTEQSNRGTEHVVTESPACLRIATGSDCHEDC